MYSHNFSQTLDPPNKVKVFMLIKTIKVNIL